MNENTENENVKEEASATESTSSNEEKTIDENPSRFTPAPGVSADNVFADKNETGPEIESASEQEDGRGHSQQEEVSPIDGEALLEKLLESEDGTYVVSSREFAALVALDAVDNLAVVKKMKKNGKQILIQD